MNHAAAAGTATPVAATVRPPPRLDGASPTPRPSPHGSPPRTDSPADPRGRRSCSRALCRSPNPRRSPAAAHRPPATRSSGTPTGPPPRRSQPAPARPPDAIAPAPSRPAQPPVSSHSPGHVVCRSIGLHRTGRRPRSTTAAPPATRTDSTSRTTRRSLSNLRPPPARDAACSSPRRCAAEIRPRDLSDEAGREDRRRSRRHDEPLGAGGVDRAWGVGKDSASARWDGRAVEGTGLENRRGALRHRGFESHSHR